MKRTRRTLRICALCPGSRGRHRGSLWTTYSQRVSSCPLLKPIELRTSKDRRRDLGLEWTSVGSRKDAGYRTDHQSAFNCRKDPEASIAPDAHQQNKISLAKKATTGHNVNRSSPKQNTLWSRISYTPISYK